MSAPPPADRSPARMASVRCLFFIFSSLMWVGAHVPPANGIEKAALHTKRKSPHPHGSGSPPHRSWIIRSRKTGSSPGSESSRGCVFPSILSDRTHVHAALLFLTVAGPLRHRPDSLLSPRGHLFSMQFSFTCMTFYGIFYLLSIRINGKLFSNTRVTQ